MSMYRTKTVMVDAAMWSGGEFVGGSPAWVEEAAARPWGTMGALILKPERREVWVRSNSLDYGLDHQRVRIDDFLVRWSDGSLSVFHEAEFMRLFGSI